MVGHDNEGSEGTAEFTFSTTADSVNLVQIGITGGSASLGQGDPSGLYFEAGDLSDNDGDGKTDVTMSATTPTNGAASSPSAAPLIRASSI